MDLFYREPINKEYLQSERYVAVGYGKAMKNKKVVKAFYDYKDLEEFSKCKDRLYVNKIKKIKRKKDEEIKRRNYSDKEKQYLHLRQYNYFCGNYPDSILSKLLRFHCTSYDNPSQLFKIQNQQFFEIEHLVQFSRGGKDDFSNCYLLCSNCHAVKTAMERNTEKLKIMEEVFKKEGNKLCNDFRDNFLRNMEKYILENEYNLKYPQEVDKFKDIVISIHKNDICIIKHKY
jgi:5-methylcytosine-specific restriction endonuclease McrA